MLPRHTLAAVLPLTGKLMEPSHNHWHHSPMHLFVPNTLYMVTGSTLQRQHFFRADDRLRLLQAALLEVAEAYSWSLQAWAVFSNHYHFIARSPNDATTLRKMIQRLHSQTARTVNQLDLASGRQVWFQYWDTCLTHERSYYARLNYVHNNPVKHGLVGVAEDYPFCSAAWFQSNADEAFRAKVETFRADRVKVRDDFSVVWYGPPEINSDTTGARLPHSTATTATTSGTTGAGLPHSTATTATTLRRSGSLEASNEREDS